MIETTETHAPCGHIATGRHHTSLIGALRLLLVIVDALTVEDPSHYIVGEHFVHMHVKSYANIPRIRSIYRMGVTVGAKSNLCLENQSRLDLFVIGSSVIFPQLCLPWLHRGRFIDRAFSHRPALRYFRMCSKTYN
jgi:hypothetical protein